LKTIKKYARIIFDLTAVIFLFSVSLTLLCVGLFFEMKGAQCIGAVVGIIDIGYAFVIAMQFREFLEVWSRSED
jgi:ABC-type microcin C transport system permease subunit YejE